MENEFKGFSLDKIKLKLVKNLDFLAHELQELSKNSQYYGSVFQYQQLQLMNIEAQTRILAIFTNIEMAEKGLLNTKGDLSLNNENIQNESDTIRYDL